MASRWHIRIASTSALPWGPLWTNIRWLEHSTVTPRQSVWQPSGPMRDWVDGGGGADGVETLDEGATHILGWMQWVGARAHHATQNGTSFQTYQLSNSGIFHVIFSDPSWPGVTETTGSKTEDKRRLLYINVLAIYSSSFVKCTYKSLAYF